MYTLYLKSFILRDSHRKNIVSDIERLSLSMLKSPNRLSTLVCPPVLVNRDRVWTEGHGSWSRSIQKVDQLSTVRRRASLFQIVFEV